MCLCLGALIFGGSGAIAEAAYVHVKSNENGGYFVFENTEGIDSTNVGGNNKATGRGATAVGGYNKALNDYVTTIGYSNNYIDIDNVWTEITAGKYSTLIGFKNWVTGGKHSNALGYNNKITDATKSNAFGVLNEVKGDYTTAVGNYNNLDGFVSNGFGYRNIITAGTSTAIGYANKIEGEPSVPLYASSYGVMNYVKGRYASAFGARNTINADKANVIGFWNNAESFGMNVFGSENNWQWKDETTILDDETVTHTTVKVPLEKMGVLGNVYGTSNQVIGDRAGAYGGGNQLSGVASYAFGGMNINTGYESVIVGTNSHIGRNITDIYTIHEAQDISHALVLGSYANTATSDAIALGSFSAAKTDPFVMGYDPVEKKVIAIDATVLGNITKEDYENALVTYKENKEKWLENKKKYEEVLLNLQTLNYGSEDEKRELNSKLAEYKEKSEQNQTNMVLALDTVKAGSAWQSNLAAVSVGDEVLGLTRQITGVAAGTKDTDAVNVAQLKRLAERLENQGSGSTTASISLENGENTTVSSRQENGVTIYKVNVDLSNTGGSGGAGDGTISYQANGTNKKSVSLSDGLNFVNGKNTTAKTDANGKVTFDLNPNLTNIHSISSGEGGDEDTTLTFNERGVSMGGKHLTDLADGERDSDAATYGQLQKVEQNVGHMEARLSKGIAESGALSAALSALKPLAYDPNEKMQIMAGVGHYKGSTGMALGVAHHSNRDTLWNLGLAYSGEKNFMWQAGISLRLGKSRGENVPYRDEKGTEAWQVKLQELTKQQQEQATMHSDLQARLEKLEKENEELRRQLKQITAYLAKE